MSNPATLNWAADVDLVVVGSGIAGLTAALEAHRLGLRVLVVTKGRADECNTRWAQGGVAAVLPDNLVDSMHHHFEDTIAAGGGLCDPCTVAEVVGAGAESIAALRGLGVAFDQDEDGRPARSREGGHSAFRVIRAGGDATGHVIERSLVEAARDRRVPIAEHHTAIEILRSEEGSVSGLALLDATGTPGVLRTRAVLVATGGSGQLYEVSTNPEVATADGIALALRAGATVADMEFVQFHPTALYTPACSAAQRPLVTEAVRGEGAVLIDASGVRLMSGMHPLEDLAPRDVVSAAITRWMNSSGAPCVYLDATAIDAKKFRARFPTVHGYCAALGIDPSTDPIPVAPAAHFACGGVVATVDGRTTVPGLYAAGEVARTGLHGANRLASNSLLEGAVVGRRTARAVAADLTTQPRSPRIPDVAWSMTAPRVSRRTVQRLMSRHAAIGRDHNGLDDALTTLAVQAEDVLLETRQNIEDTAITLAATAVLTSALHRTESRGCHVRTDFPGRDDGWGHSTWLQVDQIDGALSIRSSTLEAV